MNKTDVVFVSMPWGLPNEPSIALGILKQCLSEKGFHSKIFHAAPYLLKWLTIETYEFISSAWGLNEFLFTSLIDPVCSEQQMAAIVERASLQITESRASKFKTVEEFCELIMKLRDEIIPVYLDECAERILSYSPSVVGFSCMFDQTIASVALSKKLKEYDPSIFIVFGGYALEGSTGKTVAPSFPWVDLIVQGEGEDAIVEIVQNLRSGNNDKIPENKIIKAAKINMENSLVPDYSDWFEETEKLYVSDKIKITTQVLPIESSRGCWWGQTKHCVFCGIDDDTLKYRHKSADTTMHMLRQLRSRYGTDMTFRFSDYIMPKKFYTELLPVLIHESPKFKLNSEIKANQPPERVRMLSEAGFLEVQPGIESFSTSVLKAMDKGVRGIDNVSLLKNGYINRLTILYNILYGLPSDNMEEYEGMLENIPLIYHLIPPVARTHTVVTKFAPLQTDPGRFGIKTSAVHHSCYDVLFSEDFLQTSSFDLDEYAYYFNRNFPYKQELIIKYKQLVQQIDYWKSLHRERFVELSLKIINDEIVEIKDTRFVEEASYILEGLPTKILLAAESPIKFDALYNTFNKESITKAGDILNSINILSEKRLIWKEDDMIMSLPIPKDIVSRYIQDRWPQSWSANYV